VELEKQLEACLDARDFEGAATLAVRRHGAEIFGFLVALHHDRDEASEVFSQVCERLWLGLPGFERRASLRTWLYRLARNASHDQRLRARRRREVSLSAALTRAVEETRERTRSFLRTDVRNRFEELRRALPIEAQMLLILRLDKKLGWDELVQVLHGGETLDGEALARESARLRKRFQVLKDKLRKQVRGA
jgi:RNA polymerase sigma-70 factor, ECF subfamily